MSNHHKYTCLRCGKKHDNTVTMCPNSFKAREPRYRRGEWNTHSPINKGLFIAGMTLLAIFIATTLALSVANVVL